MHETKDGLGYTVDEVCNRDWLRPRNVTLDSVLARNQSVHNRFP